MLSGEPERGRCTIQNKSFRAAMRTCDEDPNFEDSDFKVDVTSVALSCIEQQRVERGAFRGGSTSEVFILSQRVVRSIIAIDASMSPCENWKNELQVLRFCLYTAWRGRQEMTKLSLGL